jgi:hypothetical protein
VLAAHRSSLIGAELAELLRQIAFNGGRCRQEFRKETFTCVSNTPFAMPSTS